MSARTKRSLVVVAAVLACAGGLAAIAPSDARAQAAPPEPAADRAARLFATSGATFKTNWFPPWRPDAKYGHAEALIDAPLDAVHAQVVDYGHYKEFAPDKFKTARVVGKQGGNTDVYFQLPIMHGMLTLWYVTRFAPPRQPQPGTEMVEGYFVRGNIKDMHIVMTLRKVDEQHTLLACDLLLVPQITAPEAAVDEELRDAAGNAVDAVHDRAQTAVGRGKDRTPFTRAATTPSSG